MMNYTIIATIPLGFCLTGPYTPTKTRLTTRKAVLWDTSHGRYHSFIVQS